VNFPFQEEFDGKKKTRKFSSNVNSEELVWHRDAVDRTVKVVSAGGWFFQMDDELPVELKDGDTLFIPKAKWHRVIKKSTSVDLVVEIYEA